MSPQKTVLGLLLILIAGLTAADASDPGASPVNSSSRDARAEQGSSQPSTVDMMFELDLESGSLKRLQERLKVIEQQISTMLEARKRRNVLARLSLHKHLAEVPASVVTENLRVERTISEGSLSYTVNARNVSVLQILQAISKTSGLPLEVHVETGREQLLGRIWLALREVDIGELLEIVAGTQSLDYMLDENGIMIAPISALTDEPIERRLGELAMEAYQSALLEYPASQEAPRAYLGIARHHAATRFYAAANQTARDILTRYPESSACGPALLLLGSCHEALQRQDVARSFYYRYVDTYPAADDLPEVLMKVGESWFEEGKWVQAMSVFEDVVRNWPQSHETPLAMMRLAECFAGQNQYEQAVAQLELIEKSYPQFPMRGEVDFMVAESLVMLKRFASARVRLKGIIEKTESAELAERAYYALGDTFLAESEPVAALELYRGAMRSFPGGVMARAAPLRLCHTYLQMGLYAKIESTLDGLPDAAFVSREMRPIILALARYHLENGDHQKVLSLMSDLRWPHDQDTEPEILLLRARALIAAGLLDDALDKAEAASKLAKDETMRAEACRIIGEYYELRGERASAAVAYGGEMP